MRNKSVKICVMVLVLVTTLSWAGTYSGGSGTEADPYQISTVADWLEFVADANDWSAHFILTADIDLIGQSLSPVGSFTGIFDGGGHVISNVTINMPSDGDIGLFGVVDSGGEIRNLGVENADITGYTSVGGLVGSNYGVITSCYAIGSVTGNGNYIGGLVGYNKSGTIMGCYARGSVTGQSFVGGLVGIIFNLDSTISKSYAAGTVTGSWRIGGLVGWTSYGTFRACFWDIETSGQSASSGGKGLSTAQMKTLSIFQNAGWNEAEWVMADGVDCPRLAWEGTGYATIPPADPVPLTGSGTEADPYQIWTPAEFALLGWHESILDKHIELKADVNLSSIQLCPIGIMGPFTGVFNGDNHVIYNTTINLPDNDFVGLFSFVGSGGEIRNLGVEKANVTGRERVGGLAGLSFNCTISDCYTSGAVSGSGHSIGAGGLVGENYDNDSWQSGIIGCYSSAEVTGDYHIGGLVGYNDDYGRISECYATGSVVGYSCVGGLSGSHNEYSRIEMCYATGSVDGHDYVGGLVGYTVWRGCLIEDSYATGFVNGSGVEIGGFVGHYGNSMVRHCFWDIETSGTVDGVGNENPDPAGVTGKTTAEMKTLSTFTLAGWDFLETWGIEDNQTYPFLRLTHPVGDLDLDKKVDFTDFAIFANHWLEGVE